MFKTTFGVFDGRSWENLCQLVFKRKHGAEGYQHIPVSPGDYGLEGFTSISGLGFQCYCPEKQYSRTDLYNKLRGKITDDLTKLKSNNKDLLAILGTTKIKQWIFVTPELASHALLRHARKKEIEVLGWALPIIDSDFRIFLHDAEHYLVEINQIQSAKGQALDFNLTPPVLEELTEPRETYEQNIERKCGARLEPAAGTPSYDKRFVMLYEGVIQNFVEADPYLRRIEETAPTLHFRLIRLINEYAITVKEKSATWTGSAEELTRHVADGLTARIVKDLQPEMDETTASQVSRHIVSRWLAICQLDYA
jgi:hypothetical protein